jgi:hypothetical protein
MVAPGLRITARKPQCVSHNYLKSLHRYAQNRSENPRVGSSILSLGTSTQRGYGFGRSPFLLFGRWKNALAYFPKKEYFLEQENGYKKENNEPKRDDQPASKREGRSAATLLSSFKK